MTCPVIAYAESAYHMQYLEASHVVHDPHDYSLHKRVAQT